MGILRRLLPGFLAAVMVLAAGAGALIWRGFRASATPPQWEAALARMARDLSIPGRERQRKSPVQATHDSLTSGREIFLRQCAACHGIEGSGKTPVGVNLYPRVPDLRAGATQSLSDGEIHYIIE